MVPRVPTSSDRTVMPWDVVTSTTSPSKRRATHVVPAAGEHVRVTGTHLEGVDDDVGVPELPLVVDAAALTVGAEQATLVHRGQLPPRRPTRLGGLPGGGHGEERDDGAGRGVQQ